VSLVLNFSPITFDDREISAGRLPYGADGKEVLERLRSEHWATHVFRRDGEHGILAVPVTADAPLLGTKETIRLAEKLGLAAAVIRNSLLTYLTGLGRTVLSYDPMKFIARDDLLRSSIPQGTPQPDWLAVRLLYELAIRPVYFYKQKPVIAAIMDVRTTRLVERKASELIAAGFSLEGHYVGRRVSGNDPRIAPHTKLLGRVTSVDGSLLKLTDSPDMVESVEASEVWLEKRAFDACMSHEFGSCATKVREGLERQRAALRQGKARLEKIGTIVEFFRKMQYEMVPGTSFAFGPLLASSDRAFPHIEDAPKPVYVFDQTGSKTNTWHDKGLTEYGPYSAQVFTPNQPRIGIVCQQSMKGQVEQFVRKFVNGVVLPAPRDPRRRKTNYFEKGLVRKFALKNVQYEFFLAANGSVEAYKKACKQAVEAHGNGQKLDLALVQIEEPFHDLAPRANPYFACKVSFHTHQIPVQEFEIETTRRPDSQLIYVLNNMALATYAKLGGIPWLLKANPTIAHELVIGLGSADIGESRLGERERFVGITTVFSGDGNYYLSNLSKAVSMDDYRTALLESLRATILKVRNEMNWQARDSVRLVFHATFKKFSGDEVQSIKDLVSGLGDYDVEYAFLQMNEQHPYMLFDKSQNGVPDFDSNGTKGSYAPARGQYIELGNHEVLLALTGPREVKRPEDGTPRPLLLNLHRDSTFTDMTYLTRQVFAFASHSWRTFLPSSVPVTIQYSNLIAGTLGHLALMERWNPEVMLGRIGKTRWFL